MPMTLHAPLDAYDRVFFEWQTDGSTRSARQLLPLVRSQVDVSSVVDVGCGTGGWLRVWMELGVKDVLGIDGDHVPKSLLRVSADRVMNHDLRTPLEPPRRFDLALCLEVAEHLPAEIGPRLVRLLCRLSDVILFSAAQPGQGGERHVNEQPLAYWQEQFESNGYRTFDSLRPYVLSVRGVEPWYRHNTLMFANKDGVRRLSASVTESERTGRRLPPHYGDWRWSLRLLTCKYIPEPMVTSFSRMSYPLRTW